ncbi:NAD(P)-binding protein [Annulohypoxylon maeteangense]|uniref:NAD(P)-binding protein n=1 Tax=Annulohypoxylon maeteangense TaxID=1927788 RepID=UPI0020079C24|nr:NAD(P)-binding protein [Annulohypoxylon maeteangense]KAI0883867.1 NAD(P)-binding protein [Annulohypoxylon maeteangense]
MSAPRLIAVIGATGAQGIPVVRELVQSGSYKVRALTRDASSARFRELQSFGSVEPVIGTFASEKDLRATFRGAWGAFVNIDGFNSGEKAEMFWTIRAYELAIEEGVKFFILGNLDYVYKKSGYKPEFHAGHYDGKGRIGEWILQQNQANHGRMQAALLTTGPYMEMTISAHTPMAVTMDSGVATWRLPMQDGAIPFVALDDCGVYVKWLFEHPSRANGLDLEVGIAHITRSDLSGAFEKVTGRPARAVDVGFEEYFGKVWLQDPEHAAGYNADLSDPATMTVRENFTAFWNVWRNSGGNTGLVRRDYALLDEIHPARVRSAEEFFRHEEEKGVKAGLGTLWERVQPERIAHVLKITEDKRTGRL